MATLYILSIGGNDLALRDANRSWYWDATDAQAWLADPTTNTSAKRFIDAYLTLAGVGSADVGIRRVEKAAIPGLPGTEFRGNSVKIKSAVVNSGIGDIIRTSIPCRVDAVIPRVTGSIDVLVNTGSGGYDPVAFPAWHSFITEYELSAKSEEGGDVTNVEEAYYND